MVTRISKLLERIYSNSVWSFGGLAITLETPDRLSCKEGLRTRWLKVKSDGTLKGGIAIDIATMNATDPGLMNESREKRIERACRVKNFLSNKGFDCTVLEDGRSLYDVCSNFRES